MKNIRGLSNICQIGIIVKDLTSSMERFSQILGIGPFKVYTVDTDKLPGIYYRGRPANYVAKVGMAEVCSWELELIQHISGESIYKEFLERFGEGPQHVGIVVDDYEREYEKLIKRYSQPIMGGPIPGKNRTGRFDYFESESELSTIIELLDMPEVRGDPTYIYP